MYRLVLTAALTLLTLPVMAAPADRASRARPTIASHCQADCLQQNTRSGRAAPVQACRIRCDAAQTFARTEGRGSVVRSGRGTRPSIRTAALTGPVSASGYGVIFAAATPSPAFGFVVGDMDRLAAYRVAEQQCTRDGPGCRLVAEFTATCGAVAQGVVRSEHALMMTSDPHTYVITSTNAGSASNRADAEAGALAECASRDPRATCRMVAMRCGTRM